MARPTKLTPQRQTRLLDAIRLGSYIAPACGYAGIHESTYYLWRERGETSLLAHQQNLDDDHNTTEPTGTHPNDPDRDPDLPPPCPACGPEWAYIEFYEADARAQHEAEMAAIGSIREAASRHVKRRRTHADGSETVVYEWDWRAAAWLLERRFPERWRKLTADDPSDEELERRLIEKLDAVAGEVEDGA